MPPAETDVALAAAPPVAEAAALPVEAATVAEAPAPVAEAPAEASGTEAAEAPATVAEEAAAAAETEATGSLVEAAAEPAVVEEAKPAEALAPEPAPLPTYEPFKLPEGLQAAPEQLEQFSSTIGKHGLTQEAGQELMDLHGTVLKDMQTAMDQRQRDVFDQTRAGWREDFAKSAGNRQTTLLQDAKWAVSELVPDPKARAEVWSVLSFSGIGDHKAIINLLAKAAGKMRERPAPTDGLTPSRNGQSKADQRYGAPRTL